jgi:hypothetical protein
VVNAYLLPTTIDGVKSTTQKTFTIRKIVVTDGVVNSTDMEILKLNASNQNPYSHLKNVGVSYQTTPKVKLKTETPEPVIEKSMFRPAHYPQMIMVKMGGWHTTVIIFMFTKNQMVG